MSHIFSYQEVQKKLVASLFSQQTSIPDVSSELTSDFFHDEKMKIIYQALIDLYGTTPEKNITVADIYEYAKEKNVTLEENSLIDLNNMPFESPLTLTKILRRQSVQSSAREYLKELDEKLKNDSPDTLELMGQAEDYFEEMSKKLIVDDGLSHATKVDNLANVINQEEEPEVDTIPLFYNSLSPILNGGWHPGQLITVGARTGIGKTIVAVNSAEAALAAGRSVLFFSLEMTNEELLTRMLSSMSGVIQNKIKAGGHRNSDEQARLNEAIKELGTYKLKVEDNPDVTIEYIKSKAKQQAQKPEGLDMIIVDYLQLINPGNTAGRANRQEQVANMSRNLKILAKQLNVPIMILVQLNRESKDESEDRLPSKADIRESAAIAADSDVILILHRKYRDDSTDPKALFIVDKNRGGASDRKVSMRCVLEKSMFVDIDEEDEKSDDLYSSENTMTEDDMDSFIDAIVASDTQDFL